MDFNAETNEVSKKKIACKEAVEQPVECDITLPEYFPDIQRVLKCTLSACIGSVQKSGDRVNAEGTGHLSVLYLSEGNCLRCFEQNVPFSRFIENKAVESSECSVRAKTEYCNCRVVSGRRLDIHGSISITFLCCTKDCRKIICGCHGGGVETKKANMKVCNLAGCCEKGFTISETFEIGDGKPSISQLVRSEACAVIEDTKTVSGKILIKGELTVKTLYIAEGDETALQKIEHTMPINQIIEAESADDENINLINLVVSDLSVSAKTDAAGALRLLDVCAEVRAYTEIYCEDDISAVTDAYSVSYEMESKLRPVDVRSICDRFTDSYLCRSSLDLSGANIERIIDMSTAGITYNTSYVSGEVIISGTITVNLLICSTDGEVSFVERQFDFEYRHAVSSLTDNIECVPFINVTGTDYLLSADDKIDARVEISISAAVFTVSTVNVLTDISVNSEKPKQLSGAALTIYFSEAGESVWDIARHYNTTAAAIMAENSIETDSVSEKCKLLIPRA